MGTHKLLSGLLFLLGLALIIGGFFLFGTNLANDIFVLNIVVSTIVFSLYFFDILFPLVDFKDSSQRTVGSLGIRWFVVIIYSALAIALMIVANLKNPPFTFSIQLLVQGILAFGLVLGFITVHNSAKKVSNVYQREQQARSLLNEMKDATYNLVQKTRNMENLPPYLKSKIEQISEDMRYISPSNNQEATELEKDFLDKLQNINLYLNRENIDLDAIEKDIQVCKQVYERRKQIYSI